MRRPVDARGLLPIVVFAHGFDSAPARYGQLLDAWTASDYVVATPDARLSPCDLVGDDPPGVYHRYSERTTQAVADDVRP